MATKEIWVGEGMRWEERRVEGGRGEEGGRIRGRRRDEEGG
jgi:hypothetical protein